MARGTLRSWRTHLACRRHKPACLPQRTLTRAPRRSCLLAARTASCANTAHTAKSAGKGHAQLAALRKACTFYICCPHSAGSHFMWHARCLWPLPHLCPSSCALNRRGACPPQAPGTPALPALHRQGGRRTNRISSSSSTFGGRGWRHGGRGWAGGGGGGGARGSTDMTQRNRRGKIAALH